ncbi:hypothetical protein [Cohnella boryungensis]|uniref:Copper amine oxidase-like N-terminal domain-containing protein n=1 Tax=Cohnella boryungensis TaxID=768479 RepID=A0ABV8S9A9_9BACL
MKILARSLSVGIVALLLLASSFSWTSAEGSTSILTNIFFDYDIQSEDGSAIPYALLTTTDYGNGYANKKEKISFPQLAVSKPANSSLDMNPGWTGSGQYAQVGSKVYWNDNFTIKSKTSQYVTRFYELDLSTRTMKIVKQLQGENRRYGRISVFPHSGTYAVFPDTYRHEGTNGVEVYSLPSNKLLAKVSNAAHDLLEFGNAAYLQIPAYNSFIVKIVSNSEKKPPVGTPYEKNGNVYVITRTYEMSSDGSKKELTPIPDASIVRSGSKVRWEKQVSSLTYSEYYDTKSKSWLIGYKSAGKSTFTSLTSPGTSADASFSPSNKYLIVTLYKVLDAKKNTTNKYAGRGTYETLIVDAKTGKLLRKLPAFARKHTNHYYMWDFGDNLVKVYFYDRARSGYLNIETGVFVSEYKSMPRGAFSYSGNYGELLDPTPTPFLALDFRNIGLPAPGVILSDRDVWLVSLQDFANAVGASVSSQSDALQISFNDKTWKVPSGSIFRFRDHYFVPIKDLRTALGIKLQLNGGENVYKYPGE